MSVSLSTKKQKTKHEAKFFLMFLKGKEIA